MINSMYDIAARLYNPLLMNGLSYPDKQIAEASQAPGFEVRPALDQVYQLLDKGKDLLRRYESKNAYDNARQFIMDSFIDVSELYRRRLDNLKPSRLEFELANI